MLCAGEVAPRFELQPVCGLPVRLPDPGARPLALFFLRPFGCPFGRAAAARLQDGLPALDDRGLRVLAITPTPLAVLRDFVPRHHLLFPVYADERALIFDAFGVGSGGGLTSLGPRALARMASASLQRGLGALHGHNTRLTADLLIDPNGRVLYASHGATIDAMPDLDAVMRAVNP